MKNRTIRFLTRPGTWRAALMLLNALLGARIGQELRDKHWSAVVFNALMVALCTYLAFRVIPHGDPPKAPESVRLNHTKNVSTGLWVSAVCLVVDLVHRLSGTHVSVYDVGRSVALGVCMVISFYAMDFERASHERQAGASRE